MLNLFFNCIIQARSRSYRTSQQLPRQYVYSFQLHRASYCLWPMYELLLSETLQVVEGRIQKCQINHMDREYLMSRLKCVFWSDSSNSILQSASQSDEEETFVSVFASTQFPMCTSDDDSEDQLGKLVTLLTEKHSSKRSPQNRVIKKGFLIRRTSLVSSIESCIRRSCVFFCCGNAIKSIYFVK